jgi:uncharacterized membrane protein YtjA (UPF0391 family)
MGSSLHNSLVSKTADRIFPALLRRSPMLRYALIFLVVALIAAFFGFSGIAGAAGGIAQILFYIFLAIFVISLIMNFLKRA